MKKYKFLERIKIVFRVLFNNTKDLDSIYEEGKEEGKNEILLTTKFQQPQKVYDVLYGENVYETEKSKITYDMEIENIYLLGDFGVVSETPFTKSERKAIITEGPCCQPL